MKPWFSRGDTLSVSLWLWAIGCSDSFAFYVWHWRDAQRLRTGVFSFFFFCLFVFYRAPPLAFGGSQARGLIGAIVAAYTTATATRHPSHVFDLHHSSWQHWILNPLNKARDWTCNLVVPGRIRFLCAMTGTPWASILTSDIIKFKLSTECNTQVTLVKSWVPHR